MKGLFFVLMLLVVSVLANDEEGASAKRAVAVRHAAQLNVGIASSNQYMFSNPGFLEFFQTSNGNHHWPKFVEAYPVWNLANLPDSDPLVQHFEAWVRGMKAHKVEALAAFCWSPGHANPTPHAFGLAFAKFLQRWPYVKRFLAWNEPNHPQKQGVPARTAAGYYLEIFSRCQKHGCKVAAGNMFSWEPGTNHGFYSHLGPDKPCKEHLCSYLDEYKYWIDSLSGASYGHPHHRPKIWALHTWADAFGYQKHGWKCTTTKNCVTRAFSASLRGSWEHTEIWITESGGMANSTVMPASPTLQACNGAFHLRLFATDPRITRFYYFDFEGSPANADPGLCPHTAHLTGGCFGADNVTPVRPIYNVLRNRQLQYSTTCP